jgi:hypothetical protein
MFREGLLLALASNAHIPIVPIRTVFLSPAFERSAEAEALFGLLLETRRDAPGVRPRICRPSLDGFEVGDAGVFIGEPELLDWVVELINCGSRSELFKDGDSAPFWL